MSERSERPDAPIDLSRPAATTSWGWAARG